MIRNTPVRIAPEQTEETLKSRALEIQKLLQPLLTAALTACTKANDFAMRVLTQDEKYTTAPVIEFVQEGPKTDELIKLYEMFFQSNSDLNVEPLSQSVVLNHYWKSFL